MSNTSSTNQQIPQKKGRGRPKGSTAVKPQQAVKPPGVRGRPKGSTAVKSPVQSVQPPLVTRPRGRPPGSKSHQAPSYQHLTQPTIYDTLNKQQPRASTSLTTLSSSSNSNKSQDRPHFIYKP
eukprot:UN03720